MNLQRLGFGRLVSWFLPLLTVGPIAFAGIAVVTIIDWTIAGIFDLGNGLVSFLLIVIGGVIAGFVVGFGQSFALRNVVTWSGKWVRATVVGWAIAGVLWAVIFLALGGNHFSVSADGVLPAILLIGLATGAGIGIGQWLVMRRWVRMPLWWIGVTMLGWFLGAVGAYITFGWGYYVFPMIIACVIVGGITAVGISVLIGQVINEDTEANPIL